MRNDKTHRFIGALVLAITIAASPQASAGKISLSWNPVQGATGYRVYYGAESESYTDVIDVGPYTEGTLSGLENCREHFIAVKAYNGTNESASFSSEIVGWPRPGIEANPSTILRQGAQFALDLRGINFREGAQIVFDERAADGEPLVRVESIDVVSCYEIRALVSVEPLTRGVRAMEIGEHSLHVVNPDGVFGAKVVQVEFEPERLDINRASSETEDKVDGMDLVWLAYAHGAGEGHERFNPDADLNGDGFVDGEDLAYLASKFGDCWNGVGWTSEDCP